MEQLILNQASRFGVLGLPGSANFFSGWLHTIAARQQTGSQGIVFLILSVAPFATRKMRRFNIFCVHVFIPGNSGNSSCTASLHLISHHKQLWLVSLSGGCKLVSRSTKKLDEVLTHWSF
jgi:hypothetical protein